MKTLRTLDAIETALRKNLIGVAQSDTILGIIAAPTAQTAQRIRTLKGRDDSMGFIIVIPTMDALDKFAAPIPDHIRQELQQHWPGPLTAILPKHPDVSHSITGGKDTVAIRLPATHIPPLPVISTSANFSGDSNPWKIDQLPTSVQNQIDFIVPDEHPKSQQCHASTIADFTQDPPAIIRQGAVNLTTRRQ